jgi:hypothetical protein
LLYRLLARAQPYANSGENWVLSHWSHLLAQLSSF